MAQDLTKDFYNTVYQADHPSNYGGTLDSMNDRIAFLRGETKQWLDMTGLNNRAEARILEVGCGMAYLSDIHPGWHGAEYSKTAVDRVRSNGTIKIFEGMLNTYHSMMGTSMAYFLGRSWSMSLTLTKHFGKLTAF